MADNNNEEKDFEPSTYQQAIFDFIKSGRGNAIVSAVAGSGKTTTLVEAAKLIHTNNAVFFAFNKHIAVDLSRRLEGTNMQAKTIHSLGYFCVAKALGRITLEDRKYTEICLRLVDDHFGKEFQAQTGGRNLARQFAVALAKLSDLARLTLKVSVDDILTLGEDYPLDMDPYNFRRLAVIVPEVLEEGKRRAEYGKVIDFTDMVWLPHALALPVPTFDWVFVDEAQDLNAAQRELVLKCRHTGGRMLFVGDPDQAIMAFAGADACSYQVIKERTSATELPLYICYRCPRTHIILAQAIVPNIEAAPGAVEGKILTILDNRVQYAVGKGDLILCRTAAPLISMCIRLIRHRIPARVRGRDVAATLTSLARELAGVVPFENFVEGLEKYLTEKQAWLERKGGFERQIMVLRDTCDALEACYVAFKAPSVDALCDEIGAIFSDKEASVWLSTVHRAKGLEADNVYIMHGDLLPLRWSRQTPDQLQQEKNLRYIALTRAKRTLTWVRSEE